MRELKDKKKNEGKNDNLQGVAAAWLEGDTDTFFHEGVSNILV